jgi:hypothetical protein
MFMVCLFLLPRPRPVVNIHEHDLDTVDARDRLLNPRRLPIEHASEIDWTPGPQLANEVLDRPALQGRRDLSRPRHIPRDQIDPASRAEQSPHPVWERFVDWLRYHGQFLLGSRHT